MNNALDFASTCAWLKDDVEKRLQEDFRRDRFIQRFALVWATVSPGSGEPFPEPHPMVMPPPVAVSGEFGRDELHLLYAQCIRKLAQEARARAVAFVTMAEIDDEKCVLVLLEHRDGRCVRRAVERAGTLGAFEDVVLPKGRSIEGCFRDFLPQHWMH